MEARFVPGPLGRENNTATICDWGNQHLFAYGCHNSVVVASPSEMRIVALLEGHRNEITSVKWSYDSEREVRSARLVDSPSGESMLGAQEKRDSSSQRNVRLASGDANGTIIIWDVREGRLLARFSEQGLKSAIGDLMWMFEDWNFLFVVHTPNTLILWNVETQQKVWKRSIADSVVSVSRDPFSPSQLCLAASWVYFMRDLNRTSNGGSMIDRRYRVGTTRTSITAREKQKAREESELIQVVYHPHCYSQVFFLLAREILLFDLDVDHPITSLVLESTRTNFCQIFASRALPETVFAVHVDGSLTAWNLTDRDGTCSFEMISQADAVRYPRQKYSKYHHFLACAQDPVFNHRIAGIGMDGRFFLWEYRRMNASAFSEKSFVTPFPSSMPVVPLQNAGPRSFSPPLVSTAAESGDNGPPPGFVQTDAELEGDDRTEETDLISGNMSALLGEEQLVEDDDVSDVSLTFPPDSLEFPTRGPRLSPANRPRLYLAGISEGVRGSFSSIAVCPYPRHEHFIACGCGDGVIQIVDMIQGVVVSSHAVHSGAVRCVSWLSHLSIISFCCEEAPSKEVGVTCLNQIRILNRLTGRTTKVRDVGAENFVVRGLRVSHSKRFLAVLLKDRPAEIWFIPQCASVKTLNQFPLLSTIEWAPLPPMPSVSETEYDGRGNQTLLQEEFEASVTQEDFVLVAADGTLRVFTVDAAPSMSVTLKYRMPLDVGTGVITCLAWKNDKIVCGDILGTLRFFDMRRKRTESVPTHRGMIRKVLFSRDPNPRSAVVFLLTQDGEFGIWDFTAVSSNQQGKKRTLNVPPPKEMTAVDIDWIGAHVPVVASSDDFLRILSPGLQSHSHIFEIARMGDCLTCISFLPRKQSKALKYYVEHEGIAKCDSDDAPFGNEALRRVVSSGKPAEDPGAAFALRMLDNCPIGGVLRETKDIPERCLAVAQLFGSEREIRFWTLAGYYMKYYRKKNVSSLGEPVPTEDARVGGTNGLLSEPPTPQSHARRMAMLDRLARSSSVQEIHNPHPELERLTGSYGVFRDSYSVRFSEIQRAIVHKSKSHGNYKHMKDTTARCLQLGLRDSAIQLLLETPSSHEAYVADSLLACVIAASISPASFEDSLKHVATNFVASGRTSEGVQLLCLIGKRLDACNILLSCDRWEEAAMLARTSLTEGEAEKVFREWGDHLCSRKRYSKAIKVFLSLGDFDRVLVILYLTGDIHNACMFFRACEEADVLDLKSLPGKMLENMFADLQRDLLEVDCTSIALWYARRVAALRGVKVERRSSDPEGTTAALKDWTKSDSPLFDNRRATMK